MLSDAGWRQQRLLRWPHAGVRQEKPLLRVRRRKFVRPRAAWGGLWQKWRRRGV